jgi:transcriptional regulator with XRE-family HTH domain
MKRLNKTAKMAFYTARKRQGDTTKIAEQSGYSVSHVSNIMAGRRSVNQDVANVMYNISRRRVKTSELV